MQNLTKYKMKTYPEWTVPEEICRVGHFREDCPYTQPEDEDSMSKNVYSSHEESTEDISRPDRHFT